VTRWLARLTGDPFWLEEYALWFPDGDAFVSMEGDDYYLAGPTLERLGDAAAIREQAQDIVDRMFVAASLMNESVSRPGVALVVRIDEGGTKKVFATTTVTAVGRVKARGTAIIDGIPRPQPSQDLARRLSRPVRDSRHLATAVQLWADPIRTWSRLYVVLEELEAHLEKRVNAAGYSSANERERFTRSANTAEVAGPDARHGSGKSEPPANPMTLPEATRFVAGCLRQALLAHWRET